MKHLTSIKPLILNRTLYFLQGLAISLIISLPALAQPASATVTYFHNDVSGTPMVATDTAGNVVWKESHKPYGEKLRNEPASRDGKNKIGFAGSPFDASTGLSYMGARYYDPVIGRFMGVDPVGFQEGNVHSFNRYAYANNNPYRYIDPDGRDAVESVQNWWTASKAGFQSATFGDTVMKSLQAFGPAEGAAMAAIGAMKGLGASVKSIDAASKALPDATIVCRGGLCGSQAFTTGADIVVNGKLEGVSVGLGKTVAEASKNIKHGKVGVSTLGEIKAAGGKVVNDYGNHGNLSGVTADKAADIFSNVVKNPNN
jgi:RHS repeat-associated protein